MVSKQNSEIQNSFLLNDLIDLVKKLAESKIQNVYIDGKLKTFEQFCATIKFKHKYVQSMFEIVWTHALRAELLAPGSIPKFFERLSKHLTCSITSAALAEAQKSLSVCFGEHPKQADIAAHIQKNISDPRLASIVKNALDLAGLHSKISIEKTYSSFFSIELIAGCFFQTAAIVTSPKKINSARVIVIDGYVENVSELNRLFLDLVEKKERCLIFSRGFSNDIISTVAVNNNRGVFDATLLVVPFELDGINTLNDISILTGSSIISSNLGNMIGLTSLQDAGKLDSCTVTQQNVLISASSSKAAVQNHINDLITRANACEIDDVKELLYKRIRALLASSVVIRIPDNMEFSRNSSVIDKELRTIKSIISHGIQDEQPSTWICADYIAAECANILKNVGCVVIQET